MMARMARPTILIAFDGSELAAEAVRQAAVLFPSSPAVVVTVWEPGLGAVPTIAPGLEVAGPLARGFDPAVVADVDHAVEDRAAVVAGEGARLARSLGLEAEAHAIEDELNVGATIADVAAQRSASAVVIGTHGLSGLKSRLLGSTSRDVLGRCRVPVVVVRETVM
jgi:nucleotide-binding universal stress UspA family protein